MPTAPARSDAAARRAIRRRWLAAGQPDCTICHTPIADGEPNYASQLYGTVVHRICCSAPMAANAETAERCRNLREGLSPGDDFCVYPQHCRCPLVCAVNMIVLARRIGLPVIEVRTDGSLGCERAARQVGLGTHFEDRPLRDALKYGALPAVDEALDAPVSWYQPPATLLIDVTRTFQAGRITA